MLPVFKEGGRWKLRQPEVFSLGQAPFASRSLHKASSSARCLLAACGATFAVAFASAGVAGEAVG